MPAYQDPTTQNVNAWLALGRSLKTPVQAGYSNLKNDAGSVWDYLASAPTPADSMRASLASGTLGGISIPTATPAPSPYAGQPLSQADIASFAEPQAPQLPNSPLLAAGQAASDTPDLATSLMAPSAPDMAPPTSAAAMPAPSMPLPGRSLAPGVTPPPAADPMADYKSVMDQLRAKGQDLADQQRSNLDVLRQGLANQAAIPAQMDLSPLLALVDSQTGSHLSQGYMRPETAQQRLADVQRGQEALANAGLGATKTEMSNLENQANAAAREAQFSADQNYKNQTLGLEKQKVDLEKLKTAATIANKGAVTPKDAFEINKDLASTDAGKKIQGTIGFTNAVNNYLSVVNDPGIPIGEKQARLNAAYSNIQTEFKNLEGLRAFTEGELGVASLAIQNQGGIGNWLKTMTQNGPAGINAAADVLRKISDASFAEKMGTLRNMSKSVGGVVDPMLDSWTQDYMATRGFKPYAGGGQLEPGMYVGGHVYMGGNPKDQGSWRNLDGRN